MYCFDEILFNEESRKLWKKFGRKKHGLRSTYIYLSVVSKDKTGSYFDKWFRTSTREISYRSDFNQKGVKEHINTLRIIGLVERRIKRKIVKDENMEKYETESYYRLRQRTFEYLDEAINKYDFIDIAKYVKQTGKKERIKS